MKNDGTVWAWGSNGYGQVGDGTTNNALIPLQVNGLSGVSAISGGLNHSLALKNDGTVWSWGYNLHGQLGIGYPPLSSLTPVQVTSLSDVVAIAAGSLFSAALKSDGTVWMWGYGISGAL